MQETKPQAVSRATDEQLLALGREVLAIEADAVSALARKLDASFVAATRMILAAQGRVIVTGVGKSGHIGRKLAATFASTGTPAYFVHAAEAAHGDLGMITGGDVVIALSNSGTTAEVLTIAPLIKRHGARLIAITGNPASALAKLADVHLDATIEREACPLNLAPTASTTAALALGDALAVALLDARGFGPDDFARSHPGGALGRRLLTRVSDVMRTGDRIPHVRESASFGEALLEVTRGGMGMTAIVDEAMHAIGIFTDGDLRRLLGAQTDFRGLSVADVMHRSPRSIGPDQLAAEAAATMERARINQILVLDESGVLVGALNTHDLMDAKVI
ncbi:KpsF/GutQ family sugar-phosphate isomerase [Niveibacterium sp. 24ML]|uniref:KpsF/GutQ family sugar-phosphate isomerase n=1 Tax=Niveibacterium sp. 24ML TaxID=2985512 RepID=UPI00226F5D0E|nr:KpsF/GutQ family sugar-phosphate isomerase [Niveibacterium sp. 24ML]MCX9154831.1 KpsF/GutQ family sugar-phosphate isomerase [Niveibacterium sp. 24ML]